jgi:hypothetical protein
MNILKENARQQTKGHWYDSRTKWATELQTSEDDSLAVLDQVMGKPNLRASELTIIVGFTRFGCSIIRS